MEGLYKNFKEFLIRKAYASRHLHRLALGLSGNGKRGALCAFVSIEQLNDDRHRPVPWVFITLAEMEAAKESFGDALRKQVEAYSPLNEVIVYVSIIHPEDQSQTIYQFLRIKNDVCDQLPEIPINLLPIIRRQWYPDVEPVEFGQTLKLCCGPDCQSVEAEQRCGRCKKAIYCSKECQKKDWDEWHKGVCKPLKFMEK